MQATGSCKGSMKPIAIDTLYDKYKDQLNSSMRQWLQF